MSSTGTSVLSTKSSPRFLPTHLCSDGLLHTLKGMLQQSLRVEICFSPHPRIRTGCHVFGHTAAMSRVVLPHARLPHFAYASTPLVYPLGTCAPPPPPLPFEQVDTGSSAERAPCLVRALCRLLRKVSLHALLQGAGRTGAAGAGGAGRQMESPEVRCKVQSSLEPKTGAGT